MIRLTAIIGLVLVLVLGWPGVQPAPAAGPSLQVINLTGRLTGPEGDLGEYDYLESGPRYRLMPGAQVELSTLDGTASAVVSGPGILQLDSNGVLTGNGAPIRLSAARSGLAKAKSQGGSGFGAVALRGGSGKKGIEVLVKTAQGDRPIRLYSGYYALVVGCGDYRAGWPDLPNAVQDARDVAAALKNMGWKVKLLENPTWAKLRTALNGLITGPGRSPDMAIMVYYAGHGHTLSEVDGTKLGYIVPVDAPDPAKDEIGFMERSISMRQVETVARRIRSKHVLMAFDSCFSGAIFQTTRARPSPYIQEKAAKPVRQFITAGNENEEVPDKSVFKTVLIQGLGEGFADRNRDGYITGQELGAYLQEQVVNYSHGGQHPQYGKIMNPKLDKGDFIFARPVKPEPKPAAAPKPQAKLAKVDTGPAVVKAIPRTGRIEVNSDVDGAEFLLGGRKFKTDARSTIVIDGVPLGQYDVIARKKGLKNWTGQVTVSVDKTARLDIKMKPQTLIASAPAKPRAVAAAASPPPQPGPAFDKPMRYQFRFGDKEGAMVLAFDGDKVTGRCLDCDIRLSGRVIGSTMSVTVTGVVPKPLTADLAFSGDRKRFSGRTELDGQGYGLSLYLEGWSGRVWTGPLPTEDAAPKAAAASSPPPKPQAKQARTETSGVVLRRYKWLLTNRGGDILVRFEGDKVTGKCEQGEGEFEGRLKGLKFSGQGRGAFRTQGTLYLTFSPDRSAFEGIVGMSPGAALRAWDGELVSGPAAKPTVAATPKTRAAKAEPPAKTGQAITRRYRLKIGRVSGKMDLVFEGDKVVGRCLDCEAELTGTLAGSVLNAQLSVLKQKPITTELTFRGDFRMFSGRLDRSPNEGGPVWVEGLNGQVIDPATGARVTKPSVQKAKSSQTAGVTKVKRRYKFKMGMKSGKMDLTFVGNEVIGNCVRCRGLLEGTLNGRVLTGIQRGFRSKSRFRLEFNEDFTGFSGRLESGPGAWWEGWGGREIAPGQD